MEANTTMSDRENADAITLLNEPGLEFRYNQRVADPHAGLSLFGPYDADLPAHPKGIVYGLIGTPEGIDAFEGWSQRIRKPILTEGHPSDELLDRKQHALWPSYPGFDAAFDATWHGRAAWTHPLDREALLHAARSRDPNHRAYEVVNLYQNALRIANQRDEALNVIVCVVPDEVWLNCRPLSRVKHAHGASVSAADRELRRTQPDLFGSYEMEEYALSVDFRRQLKARAMEFDAPIQIVRESTVAVPGPDTGARNLSPAANLAWNLTTTLFYKSGGKPWRPATARDGVCYVGLAFRRTGGARGQHGVLRRADVS